MSEVVLGIEGADNAVDAEGGDAPDSEGDGVADIEGVGPAGTEEVAGCDTMHGLTRALPVLPLGL